MSDARPESPSDSARISRPLVSVVVIFYNCDGFLAEAIDSILAQTYDNWELLLCDDGSTDGGTDRARRYAARFPDKIRHLEHPGHSNKGMSATRNLGISQARGELVTFLDGDDVYLPERLARHVEMFERYPQADVVQSPRELWHSWRGEDGPADTL